ncbi:GP41 [Agrotis ipsilon multiple nucleopolyhedrovirus]|uniref:GP41 n=1 Tax=Agrotis ipsilon multiple nucleopolyhedrovirus TaxID=208013 RepID=B6D611_9ABAC|nr:GP41 [Agrotis ipsilon multiple nucleopolyhedrovirus]ACI28798.1 GP41 [Agrotis ipsilon multiple nucleopolyhedrovirus]
MASQARPPNSLSRSAATAAASTSSNIMSAAMSGSEPWMDKCVDYVNKIVRYYRTNDMSQLTPQMLNLINTIRNVCIETYPVDVNVTKRFDSDTTLMSNYKRLQKELGDKPVSSDIFKASFVYSVLPSYAQKFYNKGGDHLASGSVEEAARHLGYAVQYQIAQAVSTNTPIPLPFDQQLASDYLTLLLQRANIPSNIQEIINSGNRTHGNSRVHMINALINNVIDDLFAGGSDYYLYVLNETNKSRILSLKENISYMAPLSATTNIFKFIATLATNSGKKPSVFQSATMLTMPLTKPIVTEPKNTCQQQLTELAFENEALRRFILQQLSYKTDIIQ